MADTKTPAKKTAAKKDSPKSTAADKPDSDKDGSPASEEKAAKPLTTRQRGGFHPAEARARRQQMGE